MRAQALLAAMVVLPALGCVHELTHRTYDDLDRLQKETRYDGKVTRYAYDAKGNRLSVTDPDGVSTSYTYDAVDRLKTATVQGQPAAVYSYWPDSLPKSTVLPNGLSESRCYDDANRLSALVSSKGGASASCTPNGTVSRFDYGYDSNGNRLSQLEQRTDPSTQTLKAAESTQYGYDVLDRLVGVAYPDGHDALYAMDAVGNRIGERSAPASSVSGLTPGAYVTATNLTQDVTAVFDRANWLLSRMDAVSPTGNATFSYDLNGNLISEQTSARSRTLDWDVRNTLTQVHDNGIIAGQYDYNWQKLRVKRSTPQENVECVLDDKYVLQEAYATTGHPSYRRYHYANQALAVADGLGTRFYTDDSVGSASDLTNTDGTVSKAVQYDAWGKNINATGPGVGDPKLGYTGHHLDIETGLVYARARYYDPALGISSRWTPRSPWSAMRRGSIDMCM